MESNHHSVSQESQWAATEADTSATRLSPGYPISESVTKLNTASCGPWPLHNRDSSWFSGLHADTLQRSIKKYGQQHPGLVRKSPASEIQYEVIAGARRWAACAALGVTFEARVLPDDIPDAVCVGLMEDENEQSQNITEIERALSYRKMIDSQVFPNMKSLGDELGVSKQYLSRIIKAASVFDTPWLADMLSPIKTSLSTANCMALLRASKSHGAEGRMTRAYGEIDADARRDSAAVVKRLLVSVERRQRVRKSVLLRSGKKKAAESVLDDKGKLVVNIDTTALKGEQIAALMQALQKQLNEIHLDARSDDQEDL